MDSLKNTARTGVLVLVALACSSVGTIIGGPTLTPEQVASMLASMHPDYTRYISEIRYGSSRHRPLAIYAGLVRRGGLDPRNPADGPESGPGATNDLIIYADTFESWRSPAWHLLLADHEYFHARHFSHGFPIPVVSFGKAGVNTDYYEALAWEYVKQRAASGAYGELSARERAEVVSRCRKHFTGFRNYVMRVQPSAWAHYGRFLLSPTGRITSAGPVPQEATSPAAGPGTR